jgi:hypothetical protein
MYSATQDFFEFHYNVSTLNRLDLGIYSTPQFFFLNYITTSWKLMLVVCNTLKSWDICNLHAGPSGLAVHSAGSPRIHCAWIAQDSHCRDGPGAAEYCCYTIISLKKKNGGREPEEKIHIRWAQCETDWATTLTRSCSAKEAMWIFSVVFSTYFFFLNLEQQNVGA